MPVEEGATATNNDVQRSVQATHRGGDMGGSGFERSQKGLYEQDPPWKEREGAPENIGKTLFQTRARGQDGPVPGGSCFYERPRPHQEV